jgi:hypothetical protein
MPAVGEEFIFLNYGSRLGGFSRIQDQTFNNGAEHWAVSYQSTNAVLTVKAGPAPVPDYGSTFLLLTLGFLGLVTYQRQLRHCSLAYRAAKKPRLVVAHCYTKVHDVAHGCISVHRAPYYDLSAA